MKRYAAIIQETGTRQWFDTKQQAKTYGKSALVSLIAKGLIFGKYEFEIYDKETKETEIIKLEQ